jgi:S-adenosylmethionine synthetase
VAVFVCVCLITVNARTPDLGTTPLPPIMHYSSQTPYTKYEICQFFSSILSLPITHITPDTTDPNVAAEQAKKEGKSFTIRPGNTNLSVDELKELVGEEVVKEKKGFEVWWKEWAESRR